MQLEPNNLVFVGLGSNLGDCRRNLADTVQRIADRFETKPVLSSVYRSAPVEVSDQPWFFNQVAFFQIAPQTMPTMVLKILKEIEQEMGRVASFRYGPRLIDLDLLFYRNWVFTSSELIIPHPKLVFRSFVLMPLQEIAPTFSHPVLMKTSSEIITLQGSTLSQCDKL